MVEARKTRQQPYQLNQREFEALIYGRARSKSRGILKTPSPARRPKSAKKVVFQIVDCYAPPSQIVNQKNLAKPPKRPEIVKITSDLKRSARPSTPLRKAPVPEKRNLNLPQGAMFQAAKRARESAANATHYARAGIDLDLIGQMNVKVKKRPASTMGCGCTFSKRCDAHQL